MIVITFLCFDTAERAVHMPVVSSSLMKRWLHFTSHLGKHQ